MRHAVSRDLHDRWDALRRARPAPEPGDVDPDAIRGVLASAFVLEVPGPARIGVPRRPTFLLSGTRVDALFGQPLRGEGFGRIWAARTWDRVSAMLDIVLEDRRPMVASARGGPPAGGEAALELMLLPLGPAGSRGWRVLGSLAVLSSPGWIGRSPTVPLELLNCRALGGPRDPRASADAVQVGRFTVHRGGRDRRTPVGAASRGRASGAALVTTGPRP